MLITLKEAFVMSEAKAVAKIGSSGPLRWSVLHDEGHHMERRLSGFDSEKHAHAYVKTHADQFSGGKLTHLGGGKYEKEIHDPLSGKPYKTKTWHVLASDENKGSKGLHWES